MIVQGVSEGFHNAATALVEGDRILYASEAERHSRIKTIDSWEIIYEI